MTDIQVGDKVRLTAEGVVSGTDWPYLRIGTAWLDVDCHKVEVIEKAKPKLKVGDTIEGREAYDSLPKGAVVSGHGDVAVADGKGNLHTSNGTCWNVGKSFYPRTLVFLP